MINYVIINGVNSNTKNGLGINELPPITKPSMRVLTEEIDGRDGDITTNLGYSAYDKTITIGLFGTGYDINDIISFFNGEGTITFSNEDDKYYKYKIINQIDYEALLKFKQATITFHCQPFKYPLSETPLEIEYDYIEQTGETLTLNNTGESILDLSLKGNTSQYSTTGKNKLPIFNTSKSVNGIAYTINNDGTIKANGTASPRSVYDLLDGGSLTLQAGTYILSGSPSGGGDTSYQLDINVGTYYADTGNGVQFTLSQETQVSYCRIRIENGTQINNMIFKPMLRLSTESADFEPYTNGASPNPDYPQDIHTINGDNEIVVCGKNLFDNNEQPLLRDSHSLYSVSNDIISMSSNGTINGGALWNIPIDITKQVVISYDEMVETTESGNNSVNYAFSDTPITTFAYGTTINKTNKTITLTPTGKYLVLGLRSMGNGGYTLKGLRVEYDSKTSYVPYTSQTYPINLGDIELNKIGDYQDYFTKNSGKNLFNYGTAIRNKTFTSQDVVSDSTGLFISDYIKVEPNTTYYVNENAPVVLGLDKDKEPLGYIRNTSSAGSFTTQATCEYIRIRAHNTTIPMETAISKTMLNKGTSATTYEPYGTGQWCKYNAIGKVVLDGTQSLQTYNWRASETSVGWGYASNVIDCVKSDNDLGIKCDKLISSSYSAMYRQEIDNGISGSNNSSYSLFVRVADTSLTTNTAINTYLSSNPITAYVPLATPYLSLIEDTTLISQLDNIQNAMSYEGQTNVLQVNNDKPFIIDAKALEQGSDEVVVNNIGNATSKPLIALEGTGNINIYLDGTQVLQANVVDKMNIDIDKLEAYNPDTSALLNRQVTGNYNSMTLPSGNSTIKIDGNLTSATITNYTRWL